MGRSDFKLLRRKRMAVKRFEIYWATLDPAVGVEMQKTRPEVVVSPNEMNAAPGAVLIAPVTSRPRALPTRIAFKSKSGADNYLALDRIRAVDKSRLTKKISSLDEKTAREACQKLEELFAY